jgi:hypothetical protein
MRVGVASAFDFGAGRLFDDGQPILSRFQVALRFVGLPFQIRHLGFFGPIKGDCSGQQVGLSVRLLY